MGDWDAPEQPKGKKTPAPAPAVTNPMDQVAPAAAQPANAVSQIPTQFLTKVSNGFEAPLSIIGAAQLGVARHGLGGIEGPEVGDATRLMLHGQFGKAAQNYSTTSLEANRQRALAGDRGAQYFQHHPTQFAWTAAGEELINPSNVVGGLVAKGAKGLAGAAARAPGLLGKAGRTAESMGEAASMRGAAGVRQAAKEQARTMGTDANAAAEQAERLYRQRALIPQKAEFQSQKVVNELFKGTTRGQRLDIVHLIENQAVNGKYSPAELADLQTRAARYQKFQANLDAQRVRNGYPVQKQVKAHTYFPHQGLYEDPTSTALFQPARIPNKTAVGGYSLGTQNMQRAYPTIRSFEQAGGTIGKDYDPADALERYLRLALSDNHIVQNDRAFTKLGLIDNSPVSGRNAHFLQGQFTSPALANSRVHPAFQAMSDTLHTRAPAPIKWGPLGVGKAVGDLPHKANTALSKLEVANFAFHPFANVGPNQLIQMVLKGGNPIDFIKGAARKPGTGPAFKIGASTPAGSALKASTRVTPISASDFGQIIDRLKAIPSTVTSSPLYQSIEPRLASGLYEALAKKVGPDKAQAIVRQTIGEPENLKGGEGGWGSLAQFPGWRAAMARLYALMPFMAPQVYNAPHRGMAAYNEGVLGRPANAFEQRDAAGMLLPPIAHKPDKNGDITFDTWGGAPNLVWNIENQAGNAAMGVPGAGAQLQSAGANILNPVLHMALGGAVRKAGESERKQSLQSFAPQQNPLQALGSQIAAYTPIRNWPQTGAWSLLGKGQIHELSPARQQELTAIQNAFLYGSADNGIDYGLQTLRADQNKLLKAGNTKGAAKLQAVMDKEYAIMQKILLQRGLIQQP